MLLRVFEEWRYKFHPYLIHKKDEEQDEKRPRDRESKIFIKRPFISEKKWCSDRNLDCNALRDVAMLVEEIRNRFMRMNISEQCLNSRIVMREDNPDAELVLKVCIGGAFYNKYVKAAYKNEDPI